MKRIAAIGFEERDLHGLRDPAKAGNLTSVGTFGWSGAAGTHFFVDREEDLAAVFMIQRMGGRGGPSMSAEFETLVYQAIVD